MQRCPSTPGLETFVGSQPVRRPCRRRSPSRRLFIGRLRRFGGSERPRLAPPARRGAGATGGAGPAGKGGAGATSTSGTAGTPGPPAQPARVAAPERSATRAPGGGGGTGGKGGSGGSGPGDPGERGGSAPGDPPGPGAPAEVARAARTPSSPATRPRPSRRAGCPVRSSSTCPPSGKLTGPLPVIFDFHPLGGTGASQESASGWGTKCDSVGCIAVFPDSATNGGNGWNVGYCCRAPKRTRSTTFSSRAT